MAGTTTKQPTYVTKLAEAIEKSLRGANVESEHVWGDRYRIIVTWKKFDRMEHPDRQAKVWQIADQTLNKANLLKISMILTLGNEDLASE